MSEEDWDKNMFLYQGKQMSLFRYGSLLYEKILLLMGNNHEYQLNGKRPWVKSERTVKNKIIGSMNAFISILVWSRKTEY